MRLNAFIFALFTVAVSQAQASSTLSSKIRLEPTAMRFVYEDFDGTFNYPCKATLSSEASPFDFTVRCYNGSLLVREFDVHLAITRYLKPTAPKTKIEILYWVNHEGATSWLSFDDETAIKEFESSQSIAGESTALRLKLTLSNRY